MYTVINTCKRGQVQQKKFCREMGALHCLTKCGIVTLNLHCCLGSGMLTKQLLQDWKHKQGSLRSAVLASFSLYCQGLIYHCAVLCLQSSPVSVLSCEFMNALVRQLHHGYHLSPCMSR